MAAVFLGTALSSAAVAQDDSGGMDAGRCTLRDHVYSCNSAAFQPLLAGAKTVAVDVHNADGVGRRLLTDFLARKLGKTIVLKDTHADLIFLLIPIEPSGIVFSSGDSDLGTLRVYSVTPDGDRGHLLWAEMYSGPPDLPWPMVARALLLQFQGHFRIK
jgi:hypothetical protein